jgi:hypothetical protein
MINYESMAGLIGVFFEEEESTLEEAANVLFEAVSAFHTKINHPNPKNFRWFGSWSHAKKFSKMLFSISSLMDGNNTRKIKRSGWMLEELAEFLQADTPEDEIDALCDILYFVIGTFCEMGYRPGTAFTAVHQANMKKNQSINGAKVTKPEGWLSPQAIIKNDIECQIEREQMESICQD